MPTIGIGLLSKLLIAVNGMLDDGLAPFGGFQHSGVGRELSTFGIEAFLEPRAILE